MARFSFKQRTAAYEELGWWKEAAAAAGAALVPVFTMTAGFLQERPCPAWTRSATWRK